ncbi:hypothetical protein [Bacteroides caccae]|jgi:hypothetical protein|uniref:hypothetical protein n=1 Tax=Bacteroides caccae TaxID=47678 RepID=UPI000154651B|nr:hypothetical protein [Bacteroides caccae]DAK96484.1 MAG TPA: hypothetical protein [Caudoviricetes sp.]ASM66397.1 hypothetical protein CGC64_10815 [Bacteroides caccae]EDM22770.1 hypothetical protein BACCAC_01163 [Bacteroides caccae ATCC 43185]MDC7280941.1 hypothetical protein [Bacteroides caccae]PQL34898.1 hypothetical protein C5Z00_09480 [Bacteroides caccae]
MNDYKDRFNRIDYCEEITQIQEIDIQGIEILNIKKEDILAFCEAKSISPEYLVFKLIKYFSKI